MPPVEMAAMAETAKWAASMLANRLTIRMPQSTESRTASSPRRKGYATAS
jgi:hypothetical protein